MFVSSSSGAYTGAALLAEDFQGFSGEVPYLSCPSCVMCESYIKSFFCGVTERNSHKHFLARAVHYTIIVRQTRLIGGVESFLHRSRADLLDKSQTEAHFADWLPA
jgi:hypothetical protein